MDILTQGLLGATLAQSAAKKEHVRLATVIGFVAGIIADADVFIRSSTDPLLVLEYHRHFTHSIFFIPIGSLIAFMLLWPFFRKKISNQTLYLYCFLGYLLSGFLDACTSYGTHLLWPLMDERISWHIISIVDPVFTVCLIVGIILGVIKTTNISSRIGLSLAATYLLIATMQFNRAEAEILELADQRGHNIEKIIVKPTMGNIILWRSIYLSDEQFYIDVVRVGADEKVYEGTSIEQFNIKDSFPDLSADTVLYNDINRFILFSDGYVSFHPDKDYILGDVRYSMNPISSMPLWGIEMDLSAPNKHVAYEFYRENTKQNRQQFMDMLFGSN